MALIQGVDVQETEYNGGSVKALQLRSASQGINVAILEEVLDSYDVPDDATVETECDHYGGPEGPEKYLEISWRTDG